MSSLRRRALALALFACLTALPAGAADTEAGSEAGLDMNPGLWKTRTTHTLEFAGMPRQPARSRASQQCVTGEAIDPSELFGAEQGCRVEDRKIAGGVMTFRMTCPSPDGEMTGSARYEATGDAGTGHLEMQFHTGEIEGTVVIDMKTERIGDC